MAIRTKEQARAWRAKLTGVVSALDDNAALENTVLFAAWAAGVDYAAGERRRYGDILYRCLQAHTSQDGWEPPVTPALWAKVLIPDPDVIPAWEQPDSTNPYMMGDRVTHDGKTWVSDVDNNVWAPGVYGWTDVAA